LLNLINCLFLFIAESGFCCAEVIMRQLQLFDFKRQGSAVTGWKVQALIAKRLK